MPQPGNSPKAVIWCSRRAPLICFCLSRIVALHFLRSSVLKTIISYILSGLFGCFRWEKKSSPSDPLWLDSEVKLASFYLFLLIYLCCSL